MQGAIESIKSQLQSIQENSLLSNENDQSGTLS